MADFISGINRIGPSYPVKPVQPAHKDRETDRRKKERQDEPEHDDRDDDERKPIIDEHV
ncbi:MAG: hypothetical protein QNJ14_06105 [Woeseiaceae bacterium]|nr:hypothetical protein [Woeseiaceae bacterium]